MALKSIQTHVSDGTLQSVQFSIVFLNTSHLHFYVDDVEITTSTASQGVAVDGVDEYGVTLTAAVPSGAVFKVQRQTPRNNVPHVFATGAALFTALTTDANNEYLLYVVQETYEQSGQGPFPTITVLAGTEYIVVETGGVRKQITAQDFLASVPSVSQVLADLADTTHSTKGAELVGVSPITVSPSFVETVTGTVRALLAGLLCRVRMLYDSSVVNVKWYNNDIQAAIDHIAELGGGTVFVPKGSYTTTGLTARNNVILVGEGDKTEIITTTDVCAISHLAPTVNTQLVGFEIRDLYIRNTLTGAKTKYDIHLQNPISCKLIRVHIRSAHDDTVYSETNVGGVYLERVDNSSVPSWINTIKDCFIQNNSIKMKRISDSVLEGGWVWGHTRQFSIHLENCANLRIANVPGIIPSQYKGGIWVNGLYTNQISIINCEFDGNPDLITGDGVRIEGNSRAGVISGNAFWNTGRCGIFAVDTIGWTISNNNFWNCNRDDSGWSDIEVHGNTLSPEGNSIAGNTHVIDATRTNTGYAARELNSGQTPRGNTYQANTITGNYSFGGIQTMGIAARSGNIGNGADFATSFGGNHLVLQKSATVSPAGTLDMVVNTATFLGQPGGFAGQLVVSSVQSNAVTYVRKTVYGVAARGTNLVANPIATQDGSGGGVAFTLTMPSNGVLRFTDTSGAGVDMYVNMVFSGIKTET